MGVQVPLLPLGLKTTFSLLKQIKEAVEAFLASKWPLIRQQIHESEEIHSSKFLEAGKQDQFKELPA